MYKFQRAFTIVELLVVIVVIGILATVVVVAYNGISQRAREASLQSDLTQARKQIEAFYAVNNVYPTANNCTNTLTTEICLKTSPGNTLTYTFVSNTASPAYTLTGNSGVVPTTGGTVVDLNGYRYHVFTSSGTLTIGRSTTMQVVLVGGGGGGGAPSGAGGGGGRLVTSSSQFATGTYSITVGAGGGGAVAYGAAGTDGTATSALGLTAAAGGAGGGRTGGLGGGSGGGPGGQGGQTAGNGGSAGTSGTGGNNTPGVGQGWSDNANLVGVFLSAGSGGIGAGSWGGAGGGGGVIVSSQLAAPINGSPGTGSQLGARGGGYGGGGGGGGTDGNGGNGAPGIVIIRYVP